MTALSPGDSWYVVGALAFVAAAVSLSAALTYLALTWWQDREERTRPERRRWVSVEQTNAESRRTWSVVSLGFTIVAILVVVVVSMFGGA